MIEDNELPTRIFFDTNVIQNILEYDLFNEELEDVRLQTVKDPRKREDIIALRSIYIANRGGNLAFIISGRVFQELSASQRSDLSNWGFEFLDYSNYFFEYEDKGIRERFGLALLKPKDRILLIDAINMNCNVFLTMDYRTIWKHKKNIKKIAILRPIELWQLLEAMGA